MTNKNKKNYDVNFISLRPTSNVGVFPYEGTGTDDDARIDFETKLDEAIGPGRWRILSFTPVIDDKDEFPTMMLDEDVDVTDIDSNGDTVPDNKTVH